MKKTLLAAGIIATTGIAGITGVAAAHAQSGTASSNANPMDSLVQAISSKFNLNQADVQKVFDSQRSQMQQEREAEIKDEIAQLVKDGKLTQAQADKLNAKRTDLEKEREANRTANSSLSASERRAKMDEQRTELDTWLSDNSIDTQYGYLLMGGHGHGGPREN
jgi:hypothetical protein